MKKYIVGSKEKNVNSRLFLPLIWLAWLEVADATFDTEVTKSTSIFFIKNKLQDKQFKLITNSLVI